MRSDLRGLMRGRFRSLFSSGMDSGFGGIRIALLIPSGGGGGEDSGGMVAGGKVVVVAGEVEAETEQAVVAVVAVGNIMAPRYNE